MVTKEQVFKKLVSEGLGSQELLAELSLEPERFQVCRSLLKWAEQVAVDRLCRETQPQELVRWQAKVELCRKVRADLDLIGERFVKEGIIDA